MTWMFLPLKRYAEFKGRSRRKEYWMFVLFLTLVYAVFVAAALMLVASIDMRGTSVTRLLASFGTVGIVVGLFWLAMLIPAIAVAVRRLHDTDRSGWWLMLYVGPYLLSLVLALASIGKPNIAVQFVPLVSLVSAVGGVVLLVFMCLDGTRGGNRFGVDPKGADLSDVFA